MKKFLISVLLFSMCVMLSACSIDPELLTKTQSAYEIILGTEEEPLNTELFGKDTAISYSSNIQSEIDNIIENEFSVLKIYDKVLEQSFDMTQYYYKNFSVLTLKKDDKSIVKEHEQLRENIKTFEGDIKNFKSAKSEFETKLAVVDNLSENAIALQELNKYKHAFATLIVKASKLNLEFADVYGNSYNIITDKDNSNIEFCYRTTFVYVIYAYNLYAFGEFDDEYKENVASKALIDSMFEKQELEFEQTNFDDWKMNFEKFKVELALYEEALNNIDLNEEMEENDVTAKVYEEKVYAMLNRYIPQVSSITDNLIKKV